MHCLDGGIVTNDTIFVFTSILVSYDGESVDIYLGYCSAGNIYTNVTNDILEHR